MTTPKPEQRKEYTKEYLIARIREAEMNGLQEVADKLRRDYANILNPPVPKFTDTWLARFVTTDTDMLRMKDKVRKLATVQDTVLVYGPTGTGKELIANALHGERTGKFIDVNCAAISPHLIESELFGHVKGAFTGAVTDKVGLFQHAKTGTMFLDEVGELPLEMQAKLLRVLQERKIRRVGGADNIDISDCRIVCATHRNLETEVRTNLFREDLYWRLNQIRIELTSLSQRPLDILPITHHIAAQFELEYKITTDDHKFPRVGIRIRPEILKGNVRSIQSIVRHYHLFQELQTGVERETVV